MTESVEFREFEPEDWDPFIKLHHRVFQSGHGDDFFEWQYRENPHADTLRMVVAEADGELAGILPYTPLKMSCGGDEIDILQPGDIMVAPEYRGQGIFTQMAEWGHQQFTDWDALIGFPNDQALPGWQKTGWATMGLNQYFRIQRPGELLAEQGGLAVFEPLGDAVDKLFGLVRRVSDPKQSGLKYDISIDPADSDTLATIASRSTTSRIHVVRSTEFYDWRLSPPGREYEMVVVSNGETEVAGVVSLKGSGAREPFLVDIVPVVDDRRNSDMVSGLLGVINHRYSDARRIRATPELHSQVSLPKHGYRGIDSLLLSKLAEEIAFISRPLGGEDLQWNINGLQIDDRANWATSCIEWPTA